MFLLLFIWFMALFLFVLINTQQKMMKTHGRNKKTMKKITVKTEFINFIQTKCINVAPLTLVCQETSTVGYD